MTIWTTLHLVHLLITIILCGLRGDSRDQWTMAAIFVYACLSYMAWATDNTLSYFIIIHLTGALVTLLFSVKKWGNYVGLMFCVGLVLDGLVLNGTIELQPMFAWLNGACSHIILAIAYGGFGDGKTYQPILGLHSSRWPFRRSGSDGNSGGGFSMEDAPKAKKQTSS